MAVSTIDGYAVKNMHTNHITALVMRRVLTGLVPRPQRVTRSPPMINPKLSMPQMSHHISTLTSERPYASMSDINTPPRKLLNREKAMSPKSPLMLATIAIVPRRSILFFWSLFLMRIGSSGKERHTMCASVSILSTTLMAIA